MSETTSDVSYLMNQPALWAVIVEVNNLLAGHGKDKHGDDDWKKLHQVEHVRHARIHLAKNIHGLTDESHLINAAARCIMARAKELSQERIDKMFLTMPELEYGTEPIEP